MYSMHVLYLLSGDYCTSNPQIETTSVFLPLLIRSLPDFFVIVDRGRSVSERARVARRLTDWLTDVSFAYLVMEWMDELVDRALVLRRVWLRPNCDSKSSQRNLQLEFERDTSKLLDEIWGMRPNFIPWPEFEKPRPWQEVAKSWHSINSGH